MEQLKEEAQKDLEYKFLWQQMEDDKKQGKTSEYGKNEDQVLTFCGRIYVPSHEGLKELILNEFHRSNYTGHPGYQKMLTTIRKVYYWPGMHKNIAEYLSKCLECRQVKVEHQHPAGLLQPIPIPEWKWEDISPDFIIGIPRTKR